MFVWIWWLILRDSILHIGQRKSIVIMMVELGPMRNRIFQSLLVILYPLFLGGCSSSPGNLTASTSSEPLNRSERHPLNRVAPSGSLLQVEAGYRHTCVLLAKDQVLCFGWNKHGQLGDGTCSDVHQPALVQGLKNVNSLAAGNHNTCALMSSGEVACFGDTLSHQLGGDVQSTQCHSFPAKIPELFDAIEVTAGRSHICARRKDGQVACWGDNTNGQVSEQIKADTSKPQEVGIDDAIQIAAAYDYTCAVRATGELVCWGDLGPGRGRSSHLMPIKTPDKVIRVAPGLFHTCALLASGRVWCWGSNSSELGHHEDGVVEGLSEAVDIVAGDRHTCALQSDGAVGCWGSNIHGQLGDGTTRSRDDFIKIANLADVTSMTAGSSFSCAIVSGESLWCWGIGDYGQFGNGQASYQRLPVKVSQLPEALHITAGASHTCALLADKTIKCWGSNMYGQLGDGSYNDSHKPVVVGINEPVLQIAGAKRHTCARLAKGNVKCWSGAVDKAVRRWRSDGQPAQSDPPATVLPEGAQEIVCGRAHACARLEDATVVCWGSNTSGQLGDGTRTSRDNPNEVHDLRNVARLALGREFSCALRTDGSVACWGSQDPLAGPADHQLLPVDVLPSGSAVGITAGSGHACVWNRKKQVTCWGNNHHHQLGNPTAGQISGPVIVTDMTDAIGATAGWGHTCALLSDGGVSCWGWNGFGQLGDGTNEIRPTAVRVKNLTDVEELTARAFHTCARQSNGKVWCWGWNRSGQLGVENTSIQITPFQVVLQPDE